MKSASFLIQIKLIKIISTPTEIGLIKQVRLTKHFILFRGGNGRWTRILEPGFLNIFYEVRAFLATWIVESYWKN